ncbi:MAG: dehydrogenase, partial [Cyclobacteriaceae bacterium]|nr:dehydrogenase [Cyclobacteriaceae bacterium]
VIKKLIDTNSDGYPDESLVFAEGLILPTSIMRWKKGFMVTDAPDVLYLEDTDGDGKADIKEVILTGFARSNPQHNLNSPVYGLDNWVYLAHEGDVHTVMFDSIFEDQGKNIRFPNKPDANSLPQNALGKSVRFKPDQGQLEVLSSRTQFGHDFDDFGRLFMATNSQHIYQEIFPYEYVNRKPDLGVFMPVAYIPEHGNNAEVFPVTKNAEHQLLTDIGVFTSACGLTIYNGGAFPQAYQGVSFVAEPVHNLVHVDKLSPNGVPFKAQRMFQQEEFLASEDPLFRPVNFYVGPDGALYVLDYYRKIIEHPEWMSEEVISSGDLYKGTNQGRIYRISPKGAKKPDFMGKKLLDNTNIEQLIENLSSDNKWFRINAQRLLVENKSANATALLRKKIANTDDSLGSLHALWVLEGTNQLKEADIIQALESTSPGVLENAIKLSEEFINNPEIVESLVQMAHKDLPLRVHFQLLLSLGNSGSQKAIDAVNYLLSLYPDDDWMVTAGMSSPYFDEESWLKSLTDSKNLNADFLTRLSYLLTMENKIEVLQGILSESIKNKDEQISVPIIKGITRGWRERDEMPDINRNELHVIQGFLISEGEASKVWRDFIKTIKVSLEESQKYFIDVLENENNDALKRASAISLILNHNDPGEKVKSYLDPRQPLPVQVASVEWLSEYADSDDSFNEYLMVNWEKLSSPVRNKAVDLMIGSVERSKLLLTAIESEKIDKSIVGWRRSVRLMNSKDEDIKER